MVFTKEQRLKGLKKQLKNLGYDVSPAGESATAPNGEDVTRPASDSPDPTDSASKKLDELERNEEAF